MQEDLGGALVDRLLQPVSDAAGPCGPDPGATPAFFELERASQGKPETQFSEAVPPNWQDVRQKAEAILERSRDLRAAILWTRAGVARGGYAALAPGLRLIRGLLENFWDDLHPMPDEGEAYARMNALATLPAPEGLLGELRHAVIVNIRSIGQVRVRDVELTLRLVQPRAGETVPSREQLMQMLGDASRLDTAIAQNAREAVVHLQGIAATAAAHATADTPAPEFKPLQRLVEAIDSLMPAQDDAILPEAAAPEADVRVQPVTAAASLSGTVSSRHDALRAIDLVCEYLERAEPTNPAPLFLRRARRLISHSFLQLVKELAPDALPEVARAVGVNPETVTIEETG